MTAVDQTRFRAALLDAAQPVPDGLLDGQGQAAGRRYAVYRNNVAVSLREALETGFPAIATLLGEANFAPLAGLYLRQEPPVSPLMMEYGAGFPDFLAAQDGLAKLGYLPDVARLELALRRSYHAADAKVLDPARLQDLAEDVLMAAQLRLAPHVQLLRSDWPALSVWRYTLEQGAPKPQMQAEDVLVVRPEFDPQPHLLPPGGGAFVAALLQGGRFGAALDAAGEAFDLPATLGLLLRTGALCDIELGQEGDRWNS